MCNVEAVVVAKNQFISGYRVAVRSYIYMHEVVGSKERNPKGHEDTILLSQLRLAWNWRPSQLQKTSKSQCNWRKATKLLKSKTGLHYIYLIYHTSILARTFGLYLIDGHYVPVVPPVFYLSYSSNHSNVWS